MQYRRIDHSGSPLTASYVSYVYDLSNPDPTESVYCCIPKGTVCFTLCLEGEYFIQQNGKWARQPQASVFGLITKRQFVKMSPHYREITIGFKPQHFQLFVQDSMAAIFEGNIIEASVLFSKDAIEQLTQRLVLSSCESDSIKAISVFLTQYLTISKDHPAISRACELLQHPNNNKVSDIAEGVNMSTTQLRNLFRDRVGMMPKELMKLSRINKALTQGDLDEETLTQLAYKLGYFDQAHFIHDFESVLELTPKQYFKNANLTFDYYNYSRLRLSSFTDHLPGR